MIGFQLLRVWACVHLPRNFTGNKCILFMNLVKMQFYLEFGFTLKYYSHHLFIVIWMIIF